MSGLENFEASEEWKNKLMKHLFMERNTVLKTTEAIKETQRYSMDISADLQNILKKKNRCDAVSKLNEKLKDENKENQYGSVGTTHNHVTFEDVQVFKSIVDDTFMGEHEKNCKKQDISDESFEAMEQMCDKTASDPNSTLFRYLHCDNKREVIEETKKRRSPYKELSQTGSDPEVAAIDRLLNGLLREDQENVSDESPLKGIETTQIEDIEAPSRFWDSTMLQTSPVKMVGLLRPSTIMEEGADVSDVSSAQTSFKSATRALPSEISSSCYETASETASFNRPHGSSANSGDQLKKKEEICNADVSRNLIDFEKLYLETNSLHIEITEVDPLLVKNEFKHDADEARDLIDLEMTMAAKNIELSNPVSPRQGKDSACESDESVIELLSDEEDQLSPFCSTKPQFESVEKYTPPDCQASLIKWDTPLGVKREIRSSSFNSSLSHQISSNSVTESPNEKNGSLHFNDTLEEVEYMMKKGMEMIQADKVIKESPTKANDIKINILQEKQNTFTVLSPNKAKKQLQSPLSNVHSYRHGATPKSKLTPKPTQNIDDPFALHIKPFPKFDLFIKPTSTCKLGSSAARKKDNFAYVVSPIGTYIKKTAMSPLMSTTKKNSENPNSTAFRELEYESRLYHPKFNQHDNQGSIKILKSPNARTLPKKAYISSELRQIKDERSPVTIPGGKKIQKYLDNAVMPAVIRHDGKAKMSGFVSKMPLELQKTGSAEWNLPKRQESKDKSLANLSLMSGDVSVYTIKDAQKL